MYLHKDPVLLQEIQDIADATEELGFLIREDGEADIDDIDIFRKRYEDVKDKLYKWRCKVDKLICENINPGSTKPTRKTKPKTTNGNEKRVQSKQSVPEKSKHIRIHKTTN